MRRILTAHRADPLAPLLAILLSALVACSVFADHERGDSYYRGQGATGGLAAQLDNAAREAYRLSEHRSSYRLDDAFGRFVQATERYRDSARYADREADRDFELVVRRYYELRGEFRHYHGPVDLRQAFHRINAPMDRLYRSHTGRDLYRDDPNVRRPQVHRDRQHRNPDRRIAVPRGRPDVDRGRAPRGNGARGRGHGRGGHH